MDKKMAKRLLSLVLAAEMFCSPLAMARAADPTHVRPETPLGEEAVERVPSNIAVNDAPDVDDLPAVDDTPSVDDAPIVDDTPLEDDTPPIDEPTVDNAPTPGDDEADNDPAVDDDVHGGASPSEGDNASSTAGGSRGSQSAGGWVQLLADESRVVTETTYQIAMSYGILMDDRGYPARYSGYYGPEVPKTDKGRDPWTWGYRINSPGHAKMPTQVGDTWYTLLPNAGRLPDLELEGFYIMGQDASLKTPWYDESSGYEKSAQVLKWQYNESWDDAVRLEPTGIKDPSDVDLTEDEDQDLNIVYGSYTAVAAVSDDDLQGAKGVYGHPEPELSRVKTDPATGDFIYYYLETYYIPVVGRWKDSSHNRLTALQVITGVEETGGSVTQETMETIYTENPRTATTPNELVLADIDADTFADSEHREFWIRVPEDQETLTLELAAFEPYYDYTVQGKGSAPVSVEITFNGEEVMGLDGKSLGVTSGWLMANGEYSPGAVPQAGTDVNERYVPRNSVNDPARSYWRVANIPLGKVAEAKDMDNDPFTTITFTVAAPNGDEAVYTIHVERLMTPVYKLGYGNTPVAMIQRDTRGNWGATAEDIRDAKDAAINDFKEYHTLGNSGIVAPGDYVYYKGEYSALAWRGLTWNGKNNYNIDLDETAIVAYQDMAFQDPGVTFTGSNGKTVEFGVNATGDYKTCVTRTIRLKTADKLTVDLYGGGGTNCWYATDASGKAYLSNTQVSQTLQNADGSDVVDLRGLKVLPGVYTMTYTLTDPLAPAQPLVAKRPLVVLPIPGDVDMDGAVTLADALALAANQTAWAASTASDLQLLRNRVWGKAPDTDVSGILGGFQPVLADRGRTDYYYPPLEGQTDYARKAWSQVTMNGSAKLELRYLGLEKGILQGEEGHTMPEDGQTGPWMTNTQGFVTIREPNSYGHYQSDVFWVGVYLTAGSLAGSTVEDLTLSLVYDSEYVAPAVVYRQNISGFDGSANQNERWQYAIYYYNMGDGSKYNGIPQTLFSGMTATDYSYRSGTDWSRSYATHYSKVIGQLETIQGSNSSSLREMVVCFQGGSGSTSRRVQLKDGCLLVMPFQLIKHPAASRIQSGEARLVELSAGMRDLNMVAKAPVGAAKGTDVASLFESMLTASGHDDQAVTLAADAGVATYAFSAQDSIYGGSTQNIREELKCQYDKGMIPIGENKTTTILLAEGTYAEQYVDNKVQANGAVEPVDGKSPLPKGLSYNSFLGRISGTPEETGTFTFTIIQGGAEYYYTLKINKRQLRFNPIPAGSYYGQTEYRGKDGQRASEDFQFVYKAEDLAPEDRPAGVTSGDRDGAELADILGGDGVYTAPTFAARTSTDTLATPVTQSTPIGDYPILLENQPLDDKYELVFDEANLRKLTIVKRPVLVDYLTVDFHALRAAGYQGIATGTAQIYSDGDRLDQVMTLTELDAEQPMIHLCLPQVVDEVFEGRRLTGDARVPGDTLTLRFAGEFQRNTEDVLHYPTNSDIFYMTSGSESRSISKVSNLTLSNTNYRLVVSDRVSDPGNNEIYGTVTRREITELLMAAYPSAMGEKGQAVYGETIPLNALRMKIFRNGQQIGDLPFDFTYDYDGVVAMAMDIHYNWVTKEEMEAGKKSPNSLVGSGWNPFADPDKGEVEDQCPYSETNNGLLTCELDGMYLCAIARKFETNDPNGQLGENGYVKCYSQYPIKVQKRTLTLTLKNMNRFYGEESAEASYTFNTAQLSATELRKLQELFPNGRTGSDEELAAVLSGDPNFKAPTIEFMKQPKPSTGPNDPNIVKVDTDVSGTTYYIVMYGAKSTNYTFRYARVDGDRQSSDQFGTSLLNIWARPIVVEDIFSMQTGDRENFATIYADSKELKLTQQVDGSTKTTFQAGPDQVTFSGPRYDADTQSVYFFNAEDSVQKSQTNVVYTGGAVYGDDQSKLGVSYTVRFIPDQGHYAWSGLSQNYFSVTELEAEGGRGQRPVEIGELKLTGEKARNYRLVYKDSNHAMPQAPANAKLINAPKPTQGMDTGDTAYMQYGTGLVILRAITSMRLKSVGRMEYDYGEVFAPGEPNPSTNKRFELEVQYDTRYENNPAQYEGDTHHNISTESVVYGYESGSDTFTRRGFTIHYIAAPNGPAAVTAAQKEAVAQAADPDRRQIIMGGENLYSTVHDGKYLFVSGKRGASDPMVYSAVSDVPLRVSTGQLTLTARDIHRFYGEENADGYVIQESYDPEDDVQPFTYTFRAAQLSVWDRERVGALLGQTITEQSVLTQADLENALATAAASEREEERAWARNFGYTAPNISTAADKASGVNMSHGKWGEYAVDISAQDFANYKVTGQPGTLYVYPRPIRITAISSSQSDPVYTIYNQTQGSIFNTSLEQDRVTVQRGNSHVANMPTWAQTLATGNRSAQLPLTGNPLVGSDQMTYKATIQYLDSTTLPDGQTDAYMRVVATIGAADGLMSSAGDVQRNYVLSGGYEDAQAWGAVKLRTIGYITVEQVPKLNYTYGDTLDLSGLKIQVVYEHLDDESSVSERVHVTYMDSNQFQSYGLYVNYWDMSRDTPPEDDAGRQTLPINYRKASTGDHLTIAPTHDTQQYIGSDGSNPLMRPFAANGMALIVSAFQDGLNQTAAQPKIVAALPTSLVEAGVDSYEVTDANPYPAKIKVSPLRLTYTVEATDKTYNGDIKTAGTVRLTNVFDRTGVQIQNINVPYGGGTTNQTVTGNITDVIYLPVGAAYENRGDDHSVYTALGYQVVSGAISFTTGSYTHSSSSLLDKNDVVEWAPGYEWDKGLLEFTFANPNVHYEDDVFANGLPGVGTADLAQYWRANQEAGDWDSYPSVSQMPVEIRNMTILGPDAANYTWGPSGQAQIHRTELTLDTDPATLGSSQAGVPYATIYKANRQSIQELLGSGYKLPMLEVDEHTNAVRLTYGEDLAKVKDMTNPAQGSTQAVHNAAGAEDYRDQLHFEYALAYQDAEGLLRQWAGPDGSRDYQDTRFFGGEVFLPAIDPDYVPDLSRLQKQENASDKTVYKGQRYRWAGEDTGLSESGYREDSGFYIDPTAYPGYATYGDAAREAYWYYDLYNTDRQPLPRDTVFYPLVRLAQTHNFNPSGDLTGDGNGDGTEDISAQGFYDARLAVRAYDLDNGEDAEAAQTLQAAAALCSKLVLDQTVSMAQAARKLAREEMEADAQIAAGSFPNDPPPRPEPIPAVKTYRQRLDMVAASWERDRTGGDGEYLVKLVEAVEFTDTMEYPERKLMDAVVYNNPTRYYSYSWDPDRSAQLRFGDADNPIDLAQPMTFAIRQRSPGGNTEEIMWTYDPEESGYTAQIYVTINSGGGGQKVRSIRIIPSVLYARVGDSPIQLGLVTDPEMPINRIYTWSSSDPSVVTVSPTGLVTFRGEGRAEITVETTNGRSCTIPVVVSPALGATSIPGSLFNFLYAGPWATLYGNYAFRPKEGMTRGELVQLLDLFLDPDREWGATQELAYIDITRKERYYGALTRLTDVGVVNGVPGSAFAGDQLATRAEFITMLARMLGLDTPDTAGLPHAFADSGEDATWAYAYIDAMAKAGVIQGVGGGNFAPGRNITREEVAVILARLLTVKLDTTQAKLITPSDMTPENWSYPAVLRAINTVLFPD